jgi:hypothetical protein
MSSNSSHFKPGVVQNPNGRAVGSRNLKPTGVQNYLFELFMNNTEKLELELGKLEGKAYVSEMLGIASYLIPKGLIVANLNNNTEREVQVFRIGGMDLQFD